MHATCNIPKDIAEVKLQLMVEWRWYVCMARKRVKNRYHGSDEVREGGRYKMSLELDQKLYHLARLRIDNVAKEDAGEYRAVAKNKHGQGVATINLNFEGGDKLKYALNVL